MSANIVCTITELFIYLLLCLIITLTLGFFIHFESILGKVNSSGVLI